MILGVATEEGRRRRTIKYLKEQILLFEKNILDAEELGYSDVVEKKREVIQAIQQQIRKLESGGD